MRRTVVVELESEDIKALKAVAKIDCSNIPCLVCPMHDDTGCIKAKAVRFFRKMEEAHNEQTNINNH